MHASWKKPITLFAPSLLTGRLPKTEYRLVAAGRKALERYLNHMEALIRATREG